MMKLIGSEEAVLATGNESFEFAATRGGSQLARQVLSQTVFFLCSFVNLINVFQPD